VVRGPRPADREIIQGFLAGSPRALGALDGWILPVIRHRTWSLSDVEEDLLQEVRMKLLKLFESGAFRGDSSLKTYVRSTTKYTCLDAVRRARVGETEELEEELFTSPFDNPVENLDRRESVRLCYRVLRGLPDGCRRLFELILEQGLDYQAMAGELEITLGTVKSRLSRCRDRAVILRARLSVGRLESK